MSNPFISRIGGVVSADIAVPEHEKELRFYSRILTTGKDPLWKEDLMNNLGIPVIGLGEKSDAYRDLPLQWMPHIQVADVGACVARAIELGGREIMHGKDKEGNSLWAGLFDPYGAAFGIIPVIPPDAIPPVEEGTERIGCIGWFDLTVPDATAAREFYAQVIGWSAEAVGMEEAGKGYSDYNLLAADGNAVGGLCHARGLNAGLPAVWMLYLPVGDLDESLRRVAEEGGKVIKEMRKGDGSYSYVVIQDPIGVHIALAPA